MELHHLRSFVAVAEELSFQRAARRLHLSRPPLSRQIQALEEELGLRLLERGRNAHISLTDAGRTFLRDARRTLASAEKSLHNARETARGFAGQLQVANIPALSAAVLPQLLSAFHREFPEIEVSLVEMEPAEQLIAVREKRVHISIYPDLGAPLDRAFEARLLFSCPMVAVLPQGHALAQTSDKEIAIHELAENTVLLPPVEASGYSDRFNQLCTATHFTPKTTHRVQGMENLLGMVAADYGVAILPELLVMKSTPAYTVRRLRAPVPLLRLKLLWLRKDPSLVLQKFLSVAKRASPAKEK